MIQRTVWLAGCLLALPAWANDAVPGADRAAQAVFSGAADFYGEVGRVLDDGWRDTPLRHEQRAWMLRGAYVAFGTCLQLAADDGAETTEQRELGCAMVVVDTLEETLGPARWTEVRSD